jgi:hypothetical protein
MKQVLSRIGFATVSFLFVAASVQAEDIAAPLSAAFEGAPGEFTSAPTNAKASALKVHAHGLRTSRRKKDKKNSGKSPFVGTWYTTVKQVENTCAAGLPLTLNIGLTIDAKLNATDKFDGSPFFTGRVLAANKIGFARTRSANGCTYNQTYVLANVNGNNGFTGLKSETTCGARSCYTVYTGKSLRK